MPTAAPAISHTYSHSTSFPQYTSSCCYCLLIIPLCVLKIFQKEIILQSSKVNPFFSTKFHMQPLFQMGGTMQTSLVKLLCNACPTHSKAHCIVTITSAAWSWSRKQRVLGGASFRLSNNISIVDSTEMSATIICRITLLLTYPRVAIQSVWIIIIINFIIIASTCIWRSFLEAGNSLSESTSISDDSDSLET